MTKRNVIKLFSSFCGFALFFCPASAVETQAADAPAPVSAIEGERIEPRQPVTEWITKIENGKVYRRLYNHTTGEWIGDWILVG